MMKLLTTLPLATWSLACGDVETAADQAAQARAVGAAGGYVPAFFNLLEWRTVVVLSDIVIPRDDRSGSATDAAVPEFMDFLMVEYTGNRSRMRSGLGWLNAESRRRFGAAFPDATAQQQLALVNDIAWPKKAREDMQEGVRFFNAFRDLTATGFFSSRIGLKDLDYRGNIANASWTGCPPEVLTHIGLSA